MEGVGFIVLFSPLFQDWDRHVDKQLITEGAWTALKGHMSKIPFPAEIAQGLNICGKCPSQPKSYFVD